MKTPGKPANPCGARRWFGAAGIVAASLFVIGRVALEPLRSVAHIDKGSMEDFAAVETFRLRQIPDLPELAFFGSSIGLWAVIPQVIADELGEPREVVRNLAIPGGTPFDLWNLIRRNPGTFSGLRMAAIEVNPIMLNWNKEEESRLQVSISQHATLEERRRLALRGGRNRQTAEWVLPVSSVRRPLRTAFLNALGPEAGRAAFPIIDRAVCPAPDWYAANAGGHVTDRVRVTPDVAARRLVRGWHVSKFQDHALREVLCWLDDRNIPVVLHQAPISADVADLLCTNPVYAKGYASYLRYLDSLRPAPDAMIRILHPAGCAIGAEGLADRTHLNEIGATAYSRFLAAKIRSLTNRWPASAGVRGG
jgi:hypothetical protein